MVVTALREERLVHNLRCKCIAFVDSVGSNTNSLRRLPWLKKGDIRANTRAAYLGYLDALIEKKESILSLSLEQLNKLSLLPKFADNGCCNGGGAERFSAQE